MPAMALARSQWRVWRPALFRRRPGRQNVRPIVGCELTMEDGDGFTGAGPESHRIREFVWAPDSGASAQ